MNWLRRIKPRLEALEKRLVLSPWPLANVNEKHALYSTYGQYYEAGGIHFHEGIDVIGADTEDVFAIEGGTVARAHEDPVLYYSYTTILAGAHGWNYWHVDPVEPNLTGQQIQTSVKIGTIVGDTTNTHPAHVHVDYTSLVQEPYYAGSVYSDIRTPKDDPLEFLNPNDDQIAPAIGGVNYRIAAHDRNGARVGSAETERRDNLYFVDTMEYEAQNWPDPPPPGMGYVWRGFIIPMGVRPPTKDIDNHVGGGSGNIDIIANLTDQFIPWPNYRLGVKSGWFSLIGRRWQDATPWVNSFRFDGEFLDVHGYTNLRSFDHTRAIYENDAFSDSEDNTSTPAYWHTLTNNDGDLIVEDNKNGVIDAPDDRYRYWNSNTRVGNAWNVLDENAADAARNAEGAFRDDTYLIYVWTFDNALNMTQVRQIVVLDNWLQTIWTDKQVYCPNEVVIEAGGQQYTANQQLPLYILTGFQQPGDAVYLGETPFANTTTDANGNAIPVALGQFAPGTYWLVADYDQDHYYHSRLDGIYRFDVIPCDGGAGGGAGGGGGLPQDATDLVFVERQVLDALAGSGGVVSLTSAAAAPGGPGQPGASAAPVDLSADDRSTDAAAQPTQTLNAFFPNTGTQADKEQRLLALDLALADWEWTAI